MNALKLTIILMMLAFPVHAADLARDPQPAVVIDPDENPWQSTGAREMGIQLERALDVAFDELRKVDQSELGEFRPRVHVLIYREDGSIVEIVGERQSVVRNVHREDAICFAPGDHFGFIPLE